MEMSSNNPCIKRNIWVYGYLARIEASGYVSLIYHASVNFHLLIYRYF